MCVAPAAYQYLSYDQLWCACFSFTMQLVFTCLEIVLFQPTAAFYNQSDEQSRVHDNFCNS